MAKKRAKARKRGALGALQTEVGAGATHRNSDLNMIGRLVREQWPIDPAKRPAVVRRLLDNVKRGDIDQSNKAAMVLTNMSRVNQADEHHGEKVDQAERHHKEGKKVRSEHAVRILVSDGRTEREVSSLREFYDTTAIEAAPALPVSAKDAPGSLPEQSGHGGPARGQNGLAHR